MTPSKIYSFVVPAGGAFQVQAIGVYFKIAAASGLLEVRGDTFGTIGQLVPGQGLRDSPFGRLEFRDLSGFDNSVTIVIAGESFVDDRVQGSVEVIDGGKSRTIAGSAFTAYTAKQVAVAGEHAFVQLFNPPGSGRNAYVKAMVLSCTVSTFIGVTPANTGGLGALAGFSKAKRLSLADGITQVRSISQVAFLGSVNLVGGYVGSAGSLSIVLQEPILIEPGYGIAAGTSDTTVPCVLTAAFELIEEAR